MSGRRRGGRRTHPKRPKHRNCPEASAYARWCRRSESNRRPAAYKAAALPLSYGGDGPDCTPPPRSSGLIQFSPVSKDSEAGRPEAQRNMTNRIDLALVNQWRAARFGPCSNTGAIDSKSGRHQSSVPCFAELRAPVGLSTTRLWRCNEFVLPAGTDGSRTRHRVKLLRLGSQI